MGGGSIGDRVRIIKGITILRTSKQPEKIFNQQFKN